MEASAVGRTYVAGSTAVSLFVPVLERNETATIELVGHRGKRGVEDRLIVSRGCILFRFFLVLPASASATAVVAVSCMQHACCLCCLS